MTQLQDRAISWEYDAPKAVQVEERSTLAKLIGVGTLIGASFLSGARIDAVEPVQPPAAVQNTTAQVVQNAEVQRAAAVVHTTIDAIPSVFNKNNHVYVVSDRSDSPAVSEAQLKELNTRLAGSPHYLVIIDKVSDYHFTTSDNKYLTGKEAAYVMLGQKVFDTAQFRSVVDGRLDPAEKSASLFVLTCDPGQGNKERDWWMSASPLLEKFGISDENDWKNGEAYGKIAVPFFQRRDFAQGIEKTIDRLDQDLTQKISVEQEKRRELEQSGNLAVKTATTRLAEYQSRLSDLATRFPSRSGDLFRPGDIPQLQQRVEEAQRAVKSGHFATAKTIGTAIQEVVAPRVAGLVDYAGAGQRIELVKKEILELQKHQFSYTASKAFNQANSILSEAESKWEHGDASYRVSIDAAKKSVLELKGTLEGAVRQYSNDGEKITRLLDQSVVLSKSKQVSVAADQLAQVKGELGRLQKAWTEKSPGYPDMLKTVESDLEKVASHIGQKEAQVAASNFRWNMFYAADALLLAGAAVAGAFRNRTVRERAVEASQRFVKLQKGMQEKEEGLNALEQLKERALTSEGEYLTLDPNSATGKLADQARTAIEKLWLFQVVANEEILSQAGAKIKSGGVLSTENYDEAINILTSKAVEFSDKNRDRIARAFNEKRGGIAALQIPIEQVAEFKRSMQEIDQEHIKLAALATANLEKIIAAREGVGSEITRLNDGIATLKGASSTLSELSRKGGKSDNLFTLPALESKLIPAIERKVSEIVAVQERDPVSASQTALFVAGVLLAVEAGVLSLSKLRSGVVPTILGLESMLTESGLKLAWVQSDLKQVSDSADAFVVSAIKALSAKKAEGIEARTFSEEIQAVLARCQRATGLNSQTRDSIEKAIEASDRLISDSRAQISTSLSIEPERVFLEEHTPIGPFTEAKRSHLDIQAAISEGDLDRAETRIQETSAHLRSANEIVQASLKALEQHDTRTDELKTRKSTIEKALPEVTAVLKELAGKYSREALAFQKSDQTLAGADKTVANNIEESRDGLAIAEKALQMAESLYKEAKPLQSSEELGRAGEGLTYAADRLEEIRAKDKKLTALMTRNESLYLSAQALIGTLSETIKSDKIISNDTRDILKVQAKAALTGVDQLRAASPINPYAVRDGQADLDDLLNATGRGINGDRSQHKQAGESIETLRESLEKASDVSKKAEENQIPDSAMTNRAQEQLKEFKLSYKALSEEYLEASRSDWRAFQKRANDLIAQVAAAQKTIITEEGKGKAVVDRMNEAAQVASDASRWSGKYGISISGSPGSSELREARKYLARGEYELAGVWTQKAQSSAETAIERAEDAVRERAAQIRAKEAAEARARAAEEAAQAASRARMHSSSSSSYSSYGGGSSFGGFGGSSSGGSSFGGFSGGSSGGTSVGGW